MCDIIHCNSIMYFLQDVRSGQWKGIISMVVHAHWSDITYNKISDWGFVQATVERRLPML